jgi:hypothetical protein
MRSTFQRWRLTTGADFRARRIDLDQEGRGSRKKVSASFFEKKEPGRRAAKKLLFLRAVDRQVPTPPVSESFLLLFFKKEALSSFPSAMHARPASIQCLDIAPPYS